MFKSFFLDFFYRGFALRFVLVAAILAANTLALAQSKPRYNLQLVDAAGTFPADIVRLYSFKNRSSRYDALQDVRFEMFRRGHLSFSVDSIHEIGNKWVAYVHSGPRFDWAMLNRGNLDGATLGSIRFRDKIFYERAMNPRQVSELFESILEYCENNGYPFATVRLDSVSIDNGKITAGIFMERNQLVVIDSVIVRGSTKTNPAYFYNYVGIKPGSIYNEKLITTADQMLSELPFVTAFKPTEVIFGEEITKVRYYLNERKASRFDGILGLQPDELTGDITITGDVKLAVQNAFKRGELISLNWRRLQTATQDIQVKFDHPYLFNTPFGMNLGFNLFRRDTSFVQVNGHLGVSYMFSGQDYIQAFVEPTQSNVISRSFNPSDGLANASITLFGAEVNFVDLDYTFNPTRGYQLFLKGAAGSRNIRKNPEIDDSFYEGIELRSTQWSGRINARAFVPIGRRNTVMLGVKGALLQAQTMFINEVYRIGGLQSIRGFDEESIFASAYSIFTLEYRFLLEKNSNLFAFFDGAWYETDTRNEYVRDTPYGFGAGISFETGAGIFSLTYALGSQFGNPIQLRGGKIHFGFVNFF